MLASRSGSGLGFLGMLASRTRSGLGFPPGLGSTNNMVLDVELPAVNCSDVMGFLGFNFLDQICMEAIYFYVIDSAHVEDGITVIDSAHVLGSINVCLSMEAHISNSLTFLSHAALCKCARRKAQLRLTPSVRPRHRRQGGRA